MSYTAGTWTWTTSGLPVSSGTTISSTVKNNQDTELATGLSTCLLKDGTQTATASVPFVQGLSAGTSFAVNSSGTITGTSTSTQVVSGPIDISASTAGQIVFPASQNASSGANTLDDYEEGTFTPAISFGGGTTGITYSNQLGNYTKIGESVRFSLRATLSAKGSSTGTALVTALPFTSKNTANLNYPCAFFGSAFASGASISSVIAAVVLNSTTIALSKFNDGSRTTLDDTGFQATTDIQLAGVYTV